MKREFYLQDAKSNKFWTIELDDNSYVANFGKTGTKGRSSSKSFDTKEKAQAECNKLIKSKLKKGYQEGSPPEYTPVDWKNAQMTEDLFWTIIELFNWKKNGDDEQVTKPAVSALAKTAPSEICEFYNILTEKLYLLDTRAHCKAGYKGKLDPDNGDDYISADDFLYLRCVVVANGKEYYEKVLKDPTKMPTEMEFESLLYVAVDAYKKQTNEEFNHTTKLSFESFENKEGWKAGTQTKPGKFTEDNLPPGNRRPS